MKYMMKLLAVLCVCGLCACSNGSQFNAAAASSWTCSTEGTSYALTNDQNRLQTSVQTISMGWNAVQLENNEDDPTVRQQILDQLSGMFAGLQGVECEVTGDDAGITLTISIDYNTASASALVQAGLLEKDLAKDGTVNASKFLDSLSAQGYTCSPEGK